MGIPPSAPRDTQDGKQTERPKQEMGGRGVNGRVCGERRCAETVRDKGARS